MRNPRRVYVTRGKKSRFTAATVDDDDDDDDDCDDISKDVSILSVSPALSTCAGMNNAMVFSNDVSVYVTII